MWSKIFKSEPRTSPSGAVLLCCASSRYASRPLTRAAATDASGLRPPRSAWQPFPCCRSFPFQPPIMIRLLHYPWIVQLSGALAVTVRCPRNRAARRPLTRSTAPRPAGGRRTRAQARGAHCAPRGDVRQLRGGGLGYGLAGGGWPVAPVSPAVSGDLRPVSGGVRRGRLPCPDGHKTGK